MDGKQKDIDGYGLFQELLIFKSIVKESATPLQALYLLKKFNGSFPNTLLCV